MNKKLNLLLLLLLFLPFVAQMSLAQERIVDGFWGIKFGSSMEEVIESMKAKDGVLNQKSSTDRILFFDTKKFAGKDCKYTLFLFDDNKMYKAMVFLQPSSESRIFNLYDDMQESLIAKYGAPTKKYDFFSKPYYKGDGYETQALKKEKATFVSYWNFEGEGFEDVIWLTISKSLEVTLYYEDEKLAKIANQKKKQANMDDL